MASTATAVIALKTTMRMSGVVLLQPTPVDKLHNLDDHCKTPVGQSDDKKRASGNIQGFLSDIYFFFCLQKFNNHSVGLEFIDTID
jgi:hypothetical protein